jgi:hypothetical protein
VIYRTLSKTSNQFIGNLITLGKEKERTKDSRKGETK